MSKNNISHLIQELEYAQQLHHDRVRDLTLSQNERRKNRRVVKQKDLIIKALKNEIPVDISYIRIMKRWLKIHQMWADYFAYYLKELKQNKLTKQQGQELEDDIKEEGGVAWQQRWIKVYNEVIDILNKKIAKKS